jgi:PAT family beta-lactamase induction signal transducer AmpG
MRSKSSAIRYAWVALLYFIQGFPAGIVNKTMPIVFSAQGVDLGKIGLLSLVGLPWTFKFLWAPLVDEIGERRHWVAASLAMIGVLVGAFGVYFQGQVDQGIWLILAGIAFFSATQDIAIDAGTIEMLEEKELGTANGIRVTAYRIALILAGGLLVSVAAGMELPAFVGGTSWVGLGWPTTWMLTGGLAILAAPLVFRMPHVERPKKETGSIGRVVLRTVGQMVPPVVVATAAWFAAPYCGIAEKFQAPFAVLFGVAACLIAAFAHTRQETSSEEPLRLLLGKPGAWAIVLFILAFKIGDGAMAPMTTPFLNRGAGMSQSEIGLLLNTFGVGGTIVGAMVGGLLTSRWGIFRSLWILGAFQAVSNLGYVYASTHPQPMPVWSAALFEAFCGGLGTAPFLAFLMSLCDRTHAATQYAFLSAVYVLSSALAGGFSGFAAEELGFGPYFLVTFFLALPAFVLLPIVRRWIPEAARDTVSA